MVKIFTPFIKLWNWIKETAWIQPLLIVGVVFAIIFSISPIVSACSNYWSNEDVKFYINRKYSLDNIFDDYENCDAYKLINNIYEAEQLYTSSTATDAEKSAAIKKLPAEKFFLMFYSESCDVCKSSSDAFDYLVDAWNGSNSYFKSEEQFKMVTIDVKEDIDDENKNDKDAMPELYNCAPLFFENVGNAAVQTQYYIQGKISEDTIEDFATVDDDSFPTPTLLLIDFTRTGKSPYAQMMFSIPGKNDKDGDAAKAMTIMDCWNNKFDDITYYNN